MEAIETIKMRKSTRKFKNAQVNEELIEKILESATQAPFALSLGREPWRFLVLEGEKKRELVNILYAVAEESNTKNTSLLLDQNIEASESRISRILKANARIIDEAPVFILVFGIFCSGAQKINHFDVHAIGASIQNILLSATDLGLGSLWIGAVWFAERQICDWTGMDYLVAGIALGYSDDDSPKCVRKNWHEVTKWIK